MAHPLASADDSSSKFREVSDPWNERASTERERGRTRRAEATSPVRAGAGLYMCIFESRYALCAEILPLISGL